jgi:hypothetical protein
MARKRLLVSLPATILGLVSLVRRQTVQVEPFEYPIDARRRDLDVVIAGEVHRDLQRTEVIVLTQIDDLADHFGVRR